MLSFDVFEQIARNAWEKKEFTLPVGVSVVKHPKVVSVGCKTDMYGYKLLVFPKPEHMQQLRIASTPMSEGGLIKDVTLASFGRSAVGTIMLHNLPVKGYLQVLSMQSHFIGVPSSNQSAIHLNNPEKAKYLLPRRLSDKYGNWKYSGLISVLKLAQERELKGVYFSDSYLRKYGGRLRSIISEVAEKMHAKVIDQDKKVFVSFE